MVRFWKVAPDSLSKGVVLIDVLKVDCTSGLLRHCIRFILFKEEVKEEIIFGRLRMQDLIEHEPLTDQISGCRHCSRTFRSLAHACDTLGLRSRNKHLKYRANSSSCSRL